MAEVSNLCSPRPKPLAMFYETSTLQLRHCFTQLILRVHHNWTVPGHRLLDRLAGDQQEPDAFVTRAHRDLVPTVEQHQRMGTGIVFRRRFRLFNVFGQHRLRIGRVTECARTGEDVSEGIPCGLDFDPLPLSRSDRYVEVIRIRSHTFHRPPFSPEFAADDSYARAVIVGYFGNRLRWNVLVSRIGHL